MNKLIKTLALVAIGVVIGRVSRKFVGIGFDNSERKWRTDSIVKDGKIYFLGK